VILARATDAEEAVQKLACALCTELWFVPGSSVAAGAEGVGGRGRRGGRRRGRGHGGQEARLGGSQGC
jgi:hypothetical protein